QFARIGPKEPHPVHKDGLASLCRNVALHELRYIVNAALHIVSVGLNYLLLAEIVDARRAKDLRMIRANRRVQFHRVVDAVDKRQVLSPNADADDLRIATD